MLVYYNTYSFFQSFSLFYALTAGLFRLAINNIDVKYATEIYDYVILRVSWARNFRTIVQFLITYWRTKFWVVQSLNSYSDQSYRVMPTFKISLWYHLSDTQCYLVKLEARWIIRIKKFHYSYKLLIKARLMKPVTLENVFEGVYSLFQIVCIRSVHGSLQEEVFLKFA